MSNIPAELKYSAEHEWVATTDTDGVVRIGITDFAQDALGDVVYVEHPEIGSSASAGDVIGEVESTKSVSDIYAPVSGEIVAVNESLDENPGAINTDPYGAGWLFDVRLSDASELDSLLTADDYENQVG
ncbi:glycine cleavage system protein GcvH [Nesterenkonia lacusekhoensis]|uniref:Glycine cleavage system H protein n=1 Tax=Nesterenkonia lacusekhoensis TaxID=150832 RepID=A0ABS4T1H8_9MICC|nr:glycine cleavage system protein GcvH [Nesterenkonia lacusekhoensis]MBP2317874.1 glycine cleavage system H protein [Nesterenkonia lacusekhoensis]